MIVFFTVIKSYCKSKKYHNIAQLTLYPCVSSTDKGYSLLTVSAYFIFMIVQQSYNAFKLLALYGWEVGRRLNISRRMPLQLSINLMFTNYIIFIKFWKLYIHALVNQNPSFWFSYNAFNRFYDGKFSIESIFIRFQWVVFPLTAIDNRITSF